MRLNFLSFIVSFLLVIFPVYAHFAVVFVSVCD